MTKNRCIERMFDEAYNRGSIIIEQSKDDVKISHKDMDERGKIKLKKLKCKQCGYITSNCLPNVQETGCPECDNCDWEGSD